MPADWLDQPQAVRTGEQLDRTALAAYVQARLPELTGAVEVRQFPGGYSNLTYLVRFGEQEVVLRRPPAGVAIKGGHDMGREYTILTHLRPVYPQVPRTLLYCEDASVLGAPFYLMERVAGVILRPHMPAAMRPAPALMAGIAAALVDNLAALHAIDYRAAGLSEVGRPAGYVQRQIEGWVKRYTAAKTDDVPAMEQTAAWLLAHTPAESGATLIHNDYKYDNLALHPDDWRRIIAVLDWEMATIGDPLMDLGTTLGYWVQADDSPILQRLALSPTTLAGNPTRMEVVEQYAQRSGRDVGPIVFYYAYGLFKIGVIVQQIYRRYKLGYTQDPRFAGLSEAVQVCGQSAWHAIQSQRI